MSIPIEVSWLRSISLGSVETMVRLSLAGAQWIVFDQCSRFNIWYLPCSISLDTFPPLCSERQRERVTHLFWSKREGNEWAHEPLTTLRQLPVYISVCWVYCRGTFQIQDVSIEERRRRGIGFIPTVDWRRIGEVDETRVSIEHYLVWSICYYGTNDDKLISFCVEIPIHLPLLIQRISIVIQEGVDKRTNQSVNQWGTLEVSSPIRAAHPLEGIHTSSGRIPQEKSNSDHFEPILFLLIWQDARSNQCSLIDDRYVSKIDKAFPLDCEDSWYIPSHISKRLTDETLLLDLFVFFSEIKADRPNRNTDSFLFSSLSQLILFHSLFGDWSKKDRSHSNVLFKRVISNRDKIIV